jgi:hypothetical protein
MGTTNGQLRSLVTQAKAKAAYGEAIVANEALTMKEIKK